MKTATAAIICGGLHLLTPWVPRVPEVVRKIKPIERKAFEPLPEDSVFENRNWPADEQRKRALSVNLAEQSFGSPLLIGGEMWLKILGSLLVTGTTQSRFTSHYKCSESKDITILFQMM